MKTGGAILLEAAAVALTLVALATASEDQKWPVECAGALVGLSPCLPFLSAPPNDLSSSPSSLCCDTVDATTNSDLTACLCHLFRNRSLLGFPVNATRLVSLLSICSTGNNSPTQIFLPSLCKGSGGFNTPPQLVNSTGSGGFNTPPELVNTTAEVATKPSKTNVLIGSSCCRSSTGDKIAAYISSFLLPFITVLIMGFVCWAVFQIRRSVKTRSEATRNDQA